MPPEPPLDSHLRIRGAQLGRLGEALNARGPLGQLHGRLDLDLDYRQPASDYIPVGSGHVDLTGLHWGDGGITDSIRGTILLTGGDFRVRDLSGTLGGGTVRGQVVLHLADPNRSHFNLAVDGLDAGRLLVPWPALAANVNGLLDLHLQGTLGRHCQGGGNLVLTRGRIFGVEVAEARLPVRFDVVPARGRARLDCSELTAQVGRGRVTGSAAIACNADTHVEGTLRFQEVDVRALARPLAENTRLSAGQVSGQIVFNGSNVRSLDDLTATVEASLTQAQAFQLPILSQLSPFVVPGRPGTPVQRGELRGRLSAGLFRVQRLSLSGDTVDLFADGTLTTAGRLDPRRDCDHRAYRCRQWPAPPPGVKSAAQRSRSCNAAAGHGPASRQRLSSSARRRHGA